MTASATTLSAGHKLLGPAQILLSAVAFGAMAIFAKQAYADGVSTGSLLFLRFLVAGLLLLPWVLWQRLPWPRGRSLLTLIAMGAVGYAGMSACYFNALHYASAGTVALLLYLFPVIVILLSSLLGEPLTRRRLLALLLALGGLVVTIGLEWSTSLHGLLLGLGAALIYALYILAGSRLRERGHPLTSACVVTLSAAVCNGAVVSLQGLQLPASGNGVLAIALIALISTVLAIALFLAGLEKTDATQASLLSTVEPVVTVLLAAVFLDEAITLSQLAGGALILAAVVVISRERKPAELTLTE